MTPTSTSSLTRDGKVTILKSSGGEGNFPHNFSRVSAVLDVAEKGPG